MVPLMAEFHLIQHGNLSIEALGKTAFERRFEIDLEAEIVRLTSLFEELSASSGSPRDDNHNN